MNEIGKALKKIDPKEENGGMRKAETEDSRKPQN